MRARMLLLAVSFLSVGVPADAVAPQVGLAVASAFVPSELTIVEGGTLTFVNADAMLPHDITSLDRVNGIPKFRSATIGLGQSPVDGVSVLPASIYPFVCSVHEYMVGNLTVLAPPAA